jgi:hypothetical protein
MRSGRAGSRSGKSKGMILGHQTQEDRFQLIDPSSYSNEVSSNSDDPHMNPTALAPHLPIYSFIPLVTPTDLNGSLDIALPLPHTPLLALVGGGREPVFPPNKVVIYHDHWKSPHDNAAVDPEMIVPQGDGGRRRKVGKVIASVEYP